MEQTPPLNSFPCFFGSSETECIGVDLVHSFHPLSFSASLGFIALTIAAAAQTLSSPCFQSEDLKKGKLFEERSVQHALKEL